MPQRHTTWHHQASATKLSLCVMARRTRRAHTSNASARTHAKNRARAHARRCSPTLLACCKSRKQLGKGPPTSPVTGVGHPLLPPTGPVTGVGHPLLPQLPRMARSTRKVVSDDVDGVTRGLGMLLRLRFGASRPSVASPHGATRYAASRHTTTNYQLACPLTNKKPTNH